MLQLDLQIACDKDNLPTEAMFELWVRNALEAVVEPRQTLTVRIAGQDEVQELNSAYRGKDNPTNVLSFPFESIPGIDEETLGDIVICKAIVESEAIAHNKEQNAHWAHMVIHGILHLCGYDHITDEEAGRMESLEIAILSSLGYANPYNN